VVLGMGRLASLGEIRANFCELNSSCGQISLIEG